MSTKTKALLLADRLEGRWALHPEMQEAAAELRRLARVEAQRDALLEQRDELRRALEIIAVGDATNPQAQAAEELIALGYWRDIPEARNYNNATKETKNETR